METEVQSAISLQTVGQYEESRELLRELAKQGFEKIIRDSPDASEAVLFYTLCLLT